jgi:16S rRNA (cytosine1407-C5)-methyltransferase
MPIIPPEDRLSRYRDLLPPDQLALLEAALQHPLPKAIRLNPLKSHPETAMQDLAARYHWQANPIPFCPTGWQIDGERLSQTIEYKQGGYFIQEAASMLPAELFELDRDSPLVLDVAAAPGGKTTHLVSRTQDLGLVVANDASAPRLAGLRAALHAWGAINTAVTQYSGERFGGWFPGIFDAVLLDAPCSMENLNSNPNHAQRPISDRERAGLARRQLNLLSSAFQAVRSGGQVVYSTCTLAPEEDEAVVDGLLRLFPGQAQVEDIRSHLAQPAPGLTHAGGQSFDPSIMQAARLWPHLFGTSGFFAVRITRTGELAGAPDASPPPPARPFERSGLVHLRRRDQTLLFTQVMDACGFDLPALLDRQDLSLWARGELNYAIPEAFLRRFESLPTFSLGLLVGESSPRGFSPSHEFAARFGLEFTRGQYHLPDDQVQPWLSGAEVPAALESEKTKATTVVVVDSAGRNLGRGRLLADRLKHVGK